MRASRTLGLLLILSLSASAFAQAPVTLPALQRGGVSVDVPTLARAMGVVATEGGNVLTWRGPGGVVTLFAGSSDALVQQVGWAHAEDVSLSAPVIVQDSRWFVPLDALPLLGLDPPAGPAPSAVALPDGRSLPLVFAAPPAAPGPPAAALGRSGWEPAEAPLAGVRFFDGAGVSLLLVDLALVPLAAPQLTRDVDRVLDRVSEAGADHVLLLVVVAEHEAAWEPVLVFEQDGRRLEVRQPHRLLVELGEAGLVTPDAPAVGAVLLPPTFSLYRPLQVEWGGTAAEVRFRR